MTPRERQLLKLLAAAYVFIADMRRLAIEQVNLTFIAKTTGIDQSIRELELLYPRLFRRYFNLVRRQTQGGKDGA